MARFGDAGTGFGPPVRRKCRRLPPALIEVREPSSKRPDSSELFPISQVEWGRMSAPDRIRPCWPSYRLLLRGSPTGLGKKARFEEGSNRAYRVSAFGKVGSRESGCRPERSWEVLNHTSFRGIVASRPGLSRFGLGGKALESGKTGGWRAGASRLVPDQFRMPGRSDSPGWVGAMGFRDRRLPDLPLRQQSPSASRRRARASQMCQERRWSARATADKPIGEAKPAW